MYSNHVPVWNEPIIQTVYGNKFILHSTVEEADKKWSDESNSQFYDFSHKN